MSRMDYILPDYYVFDDKGQGFTVCIVNQFLQQHELIVLTSIYHPLSYNINVIYVQIMQEKSFCISSPDFSQMLGANFSNLMLSRLLQRPMKESFVRFRLLIYLD